MKVGMVLIVDDHSDSCEALRRLLQREGFEAQCARGGREALTVAEAIRPRMIILDDIMPGLSGLEVLEELRARPHLARTNVLFLSGLDDAGRKSAAMAMGACDWLMKGRAVWPEIIRAVREGYNKPAAEGGGGEQGVLGPGDRGGSAQCGVETGVRD